MKHRMVRAAAALLLLGCGPVAAQVGPLEKKEISLAVGGSVSQMNKVAYAVAYNKGYFQDEGLTVNQSAFASGTPALQALVAGSADVAEFAFEHTLRMQTKGQSLTCLVVFGRYPGNVLVVKKELADSIRSVADLKGRVVGITAPGAATQNFVAQLMERAGTPWKSASYVLVGTGASAVAAMRTGKNLDALVNLDPAISELTEKGEAVVLVDSRTEAGTQQAFGGPYLSDCLAVRAEFLKANPNTSQAIANAVVRAMQWLKTASIDDIIASLPKEYYRADEAIYRLSLQRNLSAFTWDGIVGEDAVRNVLTSIAVLEPGLRSAKIDISTTHDNALVERALAKYRARGS